MKLLFVLFTVISLLLPGAVAAKDVQAYVQEGMELCQSGKYDQAIQAFNQALKLKPKDPLLITYRGVASYAKGRLSEALKDFNEAIRLNPSLGKAYYQRGMVYENQEKYAQAVPDLKKAKSLGYNVDPVFIEMMEKKASEKKGGK